jgi:plasmid maintenance system antidote protein VapI
LYWRNTVLPNENAFGETANTLAKYVEISSNEIEKTVENLTNSQKKITPDVLDNVNSA